MTSPAMNLTTQDLESIHAFYVDFKRHFLARDFDSLLTLYTDDAVVMPTNHPAVVGKQAILQWMGSFPKVTEAEFAVHEVNGRDDVAYVTGGYEMTLVPDGAPEPIQDTGKYIEIRFKQPDGRWLLARDIFNSNLEAHT